MRISSALLPLVVVAFGLTPAAALDPTQPGNQTNAMEAFRSGARALKVGETAKAVSALQYAAEAGHALAQWKLGRMYAEGKGVPQNDLRAFEYFSRIANSHAEDNPNAPEARVVANAFVELGRYYLTGIANTRVKANPGRAQEMFYYAATYFADPDAQYNLGRLYLDARRPDARQAGRWLLLAANKGQYQAQALLGHMLFLGQHVPRQAALGLMWLTLARDSAGADDKWIAEMYDAAFKQATDDERALAFVYLQRRMSHAPRLAAD
jgi:TPR repeat protein